MSWHSGSVQNRLRCMGKNRFEQKKSSQIWACRLNREVVAYLHTGDNYPYRISQQHISTSAGQENRQTEHGHKWTAVSSSQDHQTGSEEPNPIYRPVRLIPIKQNENLNSNENLTSKLWNCRHPSTYPARAATTRDPNIPTVPSPFPRFFFLRASFSAWFLKTW